MSGRIKVMYTRGLHPNHFADVFKLFWATQEAAFVWGDNECTVGTQ
jgi:3',5'-cyclic AMP phosphodiesterase CpdA